MEKIPGYVTRVSDYLNDPFFPAKDKRNPLIILEALWHCLWNRWVYDDDLLAKKLRTSNERRAKQASR